MKRRHWLRQLLGAISLPAHVARVERSAASCAVPWRPLTVLAVLWPHIAGQCLTLFLSLDLSLATWFAQQHVLCCAMLFRATLRYAMPCRFTPGLPTQQA